MKISILTPSYNQGPFIEKNIQSVLSQSYLDVEHIVIDGGSNDNTIEILKQYPHVRWVSETDEGQADALNKGLAMATGDIIGWINSDDYYEENIFHDVISHFENAPSLQWIIGDITYHYTDANIFKRTKSQEITYKNLLNNPDIVKQQGVFFRKKILDDVRGWNKNLYMVMDFDLWVRIAQKHVPKMVHNNYAYFLWHANQKSSYKNTLKQVNEICTILRNNNVYWQDCLRLRGKKYFSMTKQLLKRFLINRGLIDEKYRTLPMSSKNSSTE
jgi:glycosyltransferase involved in cell wall biosynthesis